MGGCILRRELNRFTEFPLRLIRMLLLQIHHTEVKVGLLEIRLQAQRLLEGGVCVGELIALREEGSELIAQIRALRGQLHGALHLGQSLVPPLLTKNSRQGAMGLGIFRGNFEGRARLLLTLCGLALLREHAGKR